MGLCEEEEEEEKVSVEEAVKLRVKLRFIEFKSEGKQDI